MTKRNFLQITIVVIIAVVAIGAFYLNNCIPIIYNSFISSLRQDKPEPTFEERREKQRAYYDSLPEPKLSPDQLITRMIKEKGLYDPELRRMVEWYLYVPNSKIFADISNNNDVNHADVTQKVMEYYDNQRKITNQLIENLHFEVEVTLPQETKSNSFATVDKGWSSEILLNRYNLFPEINPVLYEKLHEYSKTELAPHFVYLLLDLKKSRPDGYDRRTRYKDILALLRIYAKYKDWPSIRETVEQNILYYPGEWRDYRALDEILKLADKEGARPAYELYLKFYRNNYHYSPCSAHDSKRQDIIYKGVHTSEVWPGERQVKGTYRFYNVDSNDAYIELRNVVKVHSIVRNGVDISSLCSITLLNRVVVPLTRDERVEIEYMISVEPDWWEE